VTTIKKTDTTTDCHIVRNFITRKEYMMLKLADGFGRQPRAHRHTSGAQQNSCSDRLLRKRIVLSRLF